MGWPILSDVSGQSPPDLSSVGEIVKKQAKTPARRGFVVFGSLVGVLGLTTVLLRAMQGTPLTADAASSLVSNEAGRSLLAIFNTRVSTPSNRWNAIFIHHTRTANGNTEALAQAGMGGDHFVIGNGDGAIDGEIQFTSLWDQQQPAHPASGQASVEPTCISISLVGDFDRGAPTASQLRRAEQLVQTLQERLHISGQQVWLYDFPGSPAGVGRYFPISAFRGQLLR